MPLGAIQRGPSISDRTIVHVNLPTDGQGMVGRVCPSCGQYFKLKPGTGLPVSACTCPYCEHQADASEFATADQIEYANSVAAKKLIEPSIRDLEKTLRQLERSTKGSFIRIKAHTSGMAFPIRYYTERQLETTVTCDGCGLVFAIYGVFASCPDCSRLTTMSLFKNSLKAAERRIEILSTVPDSELELREIILVDAISATVASFDALGKRLAREFPSLVPDKPRSLFQSLDALNDVLQRATSVSIETLVPPGQYSRIYYLFQVRHISTHNFGEIDDDFVRKTSISPSWKGKKPAVSPVEVQEFISLTRDLGTAIRQKLRDCA